jgi:multisubunit Na+/H+ antiporter MnhF subunit
MGASSNFGNMFSVLGAALRALLPMLPIQILAKQPALRLILFIGPCSVIFDYTTYFVMLYVFQLLGYVSTPAISRGTARASSRPDGSSRAC